MIALFAAMMLAPPRATNVEITSAQSVAALRECIEHRVGQTEDLDTDKGVMITVGSSTNMLGMHTTGPITIAISDSGAERHLTILYRHPFSAENAVKFLASLGKKYFPYELAGAGELKAKPDAAKP